MPEISRRRRVRPRRFAGWSHAETYSRRPTSSIALRALDQLCTGVIVTDNARLVIEMNQAAGAMVELEDGLLIREGRFCAGRVFETAKVAKLIDVATEGKSSTVAGRMVIGRCDGLSPYVLTVMPLQAEPISYRRFAMIIIVDPSRYAPSESDLTDLFGLSPAEARVAVALMTGETLSDIAMGFGLQITTVRTQLRSILKKVGVRRQFDLVRVLAGTGIGSLSLSAWWLDATLAVTQIPVSFAA